MMQNKRILRSIVIYLFAVAVMVAAIKIKKTYFIDELLSFQLANNEAGAFVFVDGELYNPRDLYTDQLSACGGLNYKVVWDNQANDVHPPLILHIVTHHLCDDAGNGDQVAACVDQYRIRNTEPVYYQEAAPNVCQAR